MLFNVDLVIVAVDSKNEICKFEFSKNGIGCDIDSIPVVGAYINKNHYVLLSPK
jgi:hypothetical protein